MSESEDNRGSPVPGVSNVIGRNLSDYGCILRGWKTVEIKWRE